jgi:CRP-like cAMP-binding protein
MSYLDILEKVEIFDGLSPNQIANIQGAGRERIFHKDAIIFEEKSPSQEFYIILNGEVEILVDPDLIRSTGDAYKPVAIAKLGPGQSFGEVALVDQGVRSASAKCISNECRVLVYFRSEFMDLLKEDLEVGFIVMQNLAADLCFKIRTTNLMVREAFLYGESK